MLMFRKPSTFRTSFVAACAAAFLLSACALSDNTTSSSGLLGDLISDGGSVAVSQPGESADFKVSETYTSVIIDARGLGLQASMSPVIYSETGSELYPGGIPVDPDFAVNEGIAAYVYGSLEQAKASSRAGDTPLLIKASAADGRSSVKISAQDASSLNKADSKSLLLSHYKVIFLLDE